jgi:uncharacterized protein YgiB involved in biofilm formation
MIAKAVDNKARKARALGAFGLALLWSATTAQAESAKGTFTFSSASNCVSSGKFPAGICSYAETNAAAEFDEKSPRFASRSVCDQAFGAGGCSVGFRGADGWAGKKTGIYFSPRQKGFRITAKSEHDISVVPLGAGGASFSPRSALRRDASINPRLKREQTSAHAYINGPATPGYSGQTNAVYGVSAPDGQKGALPPRPPVDPNFDCSSYIEAGDKGDPNTACAPVPSRR